MCKYHIAFSPKNRRKKFIVNTKKYRGDSATAMQLQDVEIIEGRIMLDFIHMLVSLPKEKCIEDHRIPYRDMLTHDIWQVRKPEIQVWEQTFFCRKLLFEYRVLN